jgi:hypothetical protein
MQLIFSAIISQDFFKKLSAKFIISTFYAIMFERATFKKRNHNVCVELLNRQTLED